MVTLGLTLKLTRTAAMLSQKDIAERAKIHVNTYRLIEDDRVSPRVETLRRICADALRLPTSTLVSLSELTDEQQLAASVAEVAEDFEIGGVQ